MMDENIIIRFLSNIYINNFDDMFRVDQTFVTTYTVTVRTQNNDNDDDTKPLSFFSFLRPQSR